jgi:SAM-dependent methyltransferase
LVFRPRASYLAKLLPQLTDAVVGDIGAGFGIFLEEVRKEWPEARYVAIEPSQEMASICRQKGFEVVEKAVEEVNPREGGFGLLTAFELFEHLYEPRIFLQTVHKLLVPGGLFFFATLSGLGFDIQILWEQSKGVSPRHHLNFFNPWSIRMLLKSVGFEVCECATPGLLDWDIVEGAYTRDGADITRFWQTVAKHATVAAREDLQSWIQRAHLSSHMRILARKPQ